MITAWKRYAGNDICFGILNIMMTIYLFYGKWERFLSMVFIFYFIAFLRKIVLDIMLVSSNRKCQKIRDDRVRMAVWPHSSED